MHFFLFGGNSFQMLKKAPKYCTHKFSFDNIYRDFLIYKQINNVQCHPRWEKLLSDIKVSILKAQDLL